MKQVRGLKGWTTGYEKLNSQFGDLETLFEFYEGGDVPEEEVDAEGQKVSATLEDLELKKMLGNEEDQLSAVLEINAGAGEPRARTGPTCFTECTCAGPKSTGTR